jgi:hypothetical protein
MTTRLREGNRNEKAKQATRSSVTTVGREEPAEGNFLSGGHFPAAFFVNNVKRLRIPEAKGPGRPVTLLTISRIGNDGFDGRLLLLLHGPETAETH